MAWFSYHDALLTFFRHTFMSDLKLLYSHVKLMYTFELISSVESYCFIYSIIARRICKDWTSLSMPDGSNIFICIGFPLGRKECAYGSMFISTTTSLDLNSLARSFWLNESKMLSLQSGVQKSSFIKVVGKWRNFDDRNCVKSLLLSTNR